MTFPDKHYTKIAVLILALYGAVNFYCSTKLSVNGDESGYFAYALNLVKGHPEKEVINGVPRFNSQLPVNVLNVIPRGIEQVFDPGLQRDAVSAKLDIIHGRIFSVISSLLLALYVLLWSTQLYGRAAGIFSLLLYVLCPNIIAHSQMVGTDVYSFLVCTATCYHAWRYAVTQKNKQLLWLALFLGLGQLTKQSLLLLYPVVFVFLLAGLIQLKRTFRFKLLRFLKEWMIIGAVSLVIINAGFLFYKTGQPLSQYRFVSAKFQQLQQQFSFISTLPLPLPEPYIAGFDRVSFNVETGPGIEGRSSYGQTTFLGERMTGKKVWYYYLVCCWYKLPLPFLLFFAGALFCYFIKRKAKGFFSNELYSLLPALFLLFSFCAFNTMYLGIKNILMILPLLFVFCGSLGQWMSRRSIQWLVAGLLCWQAVSVARYFPHFLPYTNEFIWQKKDAHKIFADGNIYFQEGAALMLEYLERHPEIQYEPAAPVRGKVIVSLESYYNWWNLGQLQWLRDMKLEPSAHFHSQYLIFDVP